MRATMMIATARSTALQAKRVERAFVSGICGGGSYGIASLVVSLAIARGLIHGLVAATGGFLVVVASCSTSRSSTHYDSPPTHRVLTKVFTDFC